MLRDGSSLTVGQCLAVFDAQLGSRHLDLAARWLRSQGKGYYTIGSSGHEGNAAVAAALRPTDPALLHYRSGGFFLARAAQVGGRDPLRDVLLGLVAATEEPIAGGRHKVFGRHDLNIIPQTSTIASHLPRAIGVAFSVARGRKLGVACPWPDDAITVCSFGDASVNHSTAVGAINAALHSAYQGVPMPLLFVCEDNGIGISVKTPRGWIEHAYGNRDGLRVFRRRRLRRGGDVRRCGRRRLLGACPPSPCVPASADGAADGTRRFRLRAGLSPARRDSRRLRPGSGAVHRESVDRCRCTDPGEVLDRYEAKRTNVIELAGEVGELPQLDSAEAVMKPLQDGLEEAVAASPASLAAAVRSGEPDAPLTLALAINRALHDILDRYPEAMIFGEDVARKGGVYGVTRGLHGKTSSARVFDTLLDEQSILGLALGAGVSGLLPIPEIQYLAYLHNAADQIRGEGATLQFFSNRQYRNPMVVRVAGYGYQKGFGGHFHNDNSIAAIRDIPGVVIASPARPDDAAAMLHTCAAAAEAGGLRCACSSNRSRSTTRAICTRTATTAGWRPIRRPGCRSAGRAPTATGTDLTILTFGNGLRMSLRVARRLESLGISARVVDLRWLAPLPVEDMIREAGATGRVLIVDETRATGGVGEGVLAALLDTATPAWWSGWPARTASSRSATRRWRCCCRRTRSRPQP